MFGIAEGVAGEGVLQADDGGDVARIDLVDLFAVVGVHLQQPADALALALGAVQHVGAGFQLARIDAEVGQAPDVRVGHDLEDQRANGALSSARRDFLFVRCSG